MTYDEAVTTWALSKFGDTKVSCYKNGKYSSSMLKEVINLDYPIKLGFDYEEGYNYSEYTNADFSFCVYICYHRKDIEQKEAELTMIIYENEIVPLAEITREILQISLSNNSSQEVYY